MRLSAAFASAISLGLLCSCSDAFVPSIHRNRLSTVVKGVSEGWDNDSFLASLSDGNDAGAGGGDDPARAALLAKMTGNKAPPKPGGGDGEEEETSSGGSRLKQIMQKKPIQAQQQTPPPPPPPHAGAPNYPPQQPGYPPQPAAQQPLFDQHGNPVALPPPPPTYYDQYGNPVQIPNLYYDQYGNPLPPPPPVQYDEYGNPLSPPRPPVPQQQQPPPPTVPGKVPRGVLRNPDADKIVNKSDVYLAQLKRDTAVRETARRSGDLEGAKKVFEDPEIAKIDELCPENPFLEEEEHLYAMIGTSDEEMLPKPGFDAPEERVQAGGPKYKEKLAQIRAKKKGGAPAAEVQPEPVTAKAEAAPSAPAAHAAEVAQPEPVQAAEPVKAEAEAPPAAPAAPVAEVAQPEPVQGPAAAAAPVQPTPVQEEAAPEAAPTEPDQDQIRHDIRTLMGLIIKHRGGPGFGSGILKAPEATRLKGVLGDVTALLRQEAGMEAGGPESAPEPEPEAPAAAVPQTQPVAAAAPVVSEAQPDIPAPLSGAIACVEGAIKAYKEASAAGREEMLPSFRSALLSAVNTCNKVIAEAEVEAAAAVQEEPKQEDAAPMTMGFPTSYAVTVPDEEVAPKPDADSSGGTTVSVGDDPNTAQLRKVYKTLKASAGDGKFGVKDLSADEMTSLGDALADMRGILMEELDSGIPKSSEKVASPVASAPAPMEELDSGIPEASEKVASPVASALEPVAAQAPSESTVSSSADSAPSGSSGSKYQQMLAKAKAEKAAKQWWESSGSSSD